MGNGFGSSVRRFASSEHTIGGLWWERDGSLRAWRRADPVQVEHTTPSIRLLLQQALGAEPQVVDVAAERSDPFPKDLGGRPRLD